MLLDMHNGGEEFRYKYLRYDSYLSSAKTFPSLLNMIAHYDKIHYGFLRRHTSEDGCMIES